METNEQFIERKEKAVLSDRDSAFSGYERLIRQINFIRAWTVAIMVASLGWAVSGSQSSIYIAFSPAVTALFAFLLLELRERSSMAFNKSEVLNIQRILMIEDQSEYISEIRNYEFRDLRLGRITRGEKFGHLFESAFSPQIVFWYGFWLAMLAFTSYKM